MPGVGVGGWDMRTRVYDGYVPYLTVVMFHWCTHGTTYPSVPFNCVQFIVSEMLVHHLGKQAKTKRKINKGKNNEIRKDKLN